MTAGADDDFGKSAAYIKPIDTPPFYGIRRGDGGTAAILGGLVINTDCQVLNDNDEPIEGLYNTGIMTGDFYANTYNFVMPGQNLGAVCGTLSYLLGKDLAQL